MNSKIQMFSNFFPPQLCYRIEVKLKHTHILQTKHSVYEIPQKAWVIILTLVTLIVFSEVVTYPI